MSLGKAIGKYGFEWHCFSLQTFRPRGMPRNTKITPPENSAMAWHPLGVGACAAEQI